MTKIPEGVRTAWQSVQTVNCNHLSKVTLKVSIQGRFRTVMPYRPDGCTSAVHHYHIKALSVRTRKVDVRMVELVHAISIYEAWSPGPWRLTSRRLNLVCTFLHYREDRPDDLSLCLDGWNLELFEASRHWWAFRQKDLVVRMDVADWWASGRNTTSSGRLTGNGNKSLKTSQNLLEEHS
jgi:hypothetical protein